MQRQLQTRPSRVGIASSSDESDTLPVDSCALNGVHHLTEKDTVGDDDDVLLFSRGRGSGEDVRGDEMAKDGGGASANVVEGFCFGCELERTVLMRTGECAGLPRLSGRIQGDVSNIPYACSHSQNGVPLCNACHLRDWVSCSHCVHGETETHQRTVPGARERR